MNPPSARYQRLWLTWNRCGGGPSPADLVMLLPGGIEPVRGTTIAMKDDGNMTCSHTGLACELPSCSSRGASSVAKLRAVGKSSQRLGRLGAAVRFDSRRNLEAAIHPWNGGVVGSELEQQVNHPLHLLHHTSTSCHARQVTVMVRSGRCCSMLNISLDVSQPRCPYICLCFPACSRLALTSLPLPVSVAVSLCRCYAGRHAVPPLLRCSSSITVALCFFCAACRSSRLPRSFRRRRRLCLAASEQSPAAAP